MGPKKHRKKTNQQGEAVADSQCIQRNLWEGDTGYTEHHHDCSVYKGTKRLHKNATQWSPEVGHSAGTCNTLSLIPSTIDPNKLTREQKPEGSQPGDCQKKRAFPPEETE